jgi:hypothetical protein
MRNIAGDVAGQVIGQMMDDIVGPVLAVLIISAVLIYLIPTIVAFLNRRRDKRSVALVNIFWGWTVIGWFVALARAFRKGGGGGSRRKSSKKKRAVKRRRR